MFQFKDIKIIHVNILGSLRPSSCLSNFPKKFLQIFTLINNIISNGVARCGVFIAANIWYSIFLQRHKLILNSNFQHWPNGIGSRGAYIYSIVFIFRGKNNEKTGSRSKLCRMIRNIKYAAMGYKILLFNYYRK